MGLFDDLRAAVNAAPATIGSLRVRDLVATGQVTQHVLDAEYRALDDEPQGGGDLRELDDCLCVIGDEHTCDDPFALGDVVEAYVSGPIECDIALDEEAEQDAALRAYLRTINMGTWLTSQPRRFGTTRIEWGA